MGRPAEDFKTGELMLVAFLTIKGFQPTDREKDDVGRCSLSYKHDKQLQDALVEYMTKCQTCDVAFSEIDKALAVARRRLLDGNFRG